MPLQRAPGDEPGAVSLALRNSESQDVAEILGRRLDRLPVVDHRRERLMEARLDRPEHDDADDSQADHDTEPHAHPQVCTSRTLRPPGALPSARWIRPAASSALSRALRHRYARVSSPRSCSRFLAVLLLGVWDSGRRLGALNHRRDEALASRADPADVAGDAAEAFRRFRVTLRRASASRSPSARTSAATRWASTGWSPSPISTPPSRRSDLASADAVMVFGAPSPPISDAFAEVDVVDGVWLGRRRS